MEFFAVCLLVVAIVLFLLRGVIADKYMFVIVFILVTLSGVMAYPWKNNIHMWDVFVALGGGATLALSFLALVGYLDYIHQEDKVEIKFEPLDFKSSIIDKNGYIETKLSVLRKDATRAEIQGRLRILADGKEYSIESLINVLTVLDNTKVGTGNQIIIPIKRNEIEVFTRLPEYEKLNSNL